MTWKSIEQQGQFQNQKKIKFLIKKGNQEGMIVGSRGGYPGTKIGGSDTVKKISILLTLGNSSKM